MDGAHAEERSIRRVEVKISSSYREAGRRYGEIHAAEIKRQIEAYESLFDLLGAGSRKVAERAREEILPASEAAFPDYVAELRGRAEGAGVPFANLFPLSCVEEVSTWAGPQKMRELEHEGPSGGPDGRCTTVGLAMHGRCLVGHNEDWCAVDLDSVMLLHDVTVPDATRFLSMQFVGLLPWTGLNSHGLAITANTLPCNDATRGAANALVLRRLLECRSLEEVWECTRLSSRGLGTYVLAGDAAGRLLAIETSARRASCRFIQGWTVETNHFTEESMVPLRSLPTSLDSLDRWSRAAELMWAGAGDDADMRSLISKVLSDHVSTSGRAICSHANDSSQPADMITMTTTLYEPADGRLWVNPAPPCRREPQLFELGAGG